MVCFHCESLAIKIYMEQLESPHDNQTFLLHDCIFCLPGQEFLTGIGYQMFTTVLPVLTQDCSQPWFEMSVCKTKG